MLNNSSNTPRERNETHDEQYRERPGGRQPVIGIPIPVTQDVQGPRLLADAMGSWAIERTLGRVFLIPLWPFPTHRHVYQSLWPLLQSMDGLLLPAGIQEHKWYPHWQEHEQHPGLQSWPIAWEIAIAQLATFIGMPILAIADGAEKWNTALGGRKQEPSGETQHPSPTTPEAWDRHPIRVRSHSTLADSLHPTIATQNGKHLPWELAFMPHQGIAQLADGLRPCAQSDDAPIVAFERKDAAFGLGVIGRLDWGLDHTYGMTLFDAFIQASKTFHQTRQQDQTWEASRDTICATVSARVAQGLPLLSNPTTTVPEPSPQQPHRARPRARVMDTQERFRQRSHPLTKTELNQMRRRRLKSATRP